MSRRPLPSAPPEPPAQATYNMSRCTLRRSTDLVWGSARPGQPKPNALAPSTPRGPLVPAAAVSEWCEAAALAGIQRVLCLLHESELAFYQGDVLDQYRAAFGASNVTHVAPGSPGDYAAVVGALRAADAVSEPIVVQCSTGQTRTAAALAVWLHVRYDAPLREAVAEVAEEGTRGRSIRKPTLDAVMQLLCGGGEAGAGPPPPTPRLTARGAGGSRAGTHITFVQTGGTIDKDYPQKNGYAFEMGEAASARLVANVPMGVTHDLITVCREDSTDIGPTERAALTKALREAPAERFVVTHGTDTMVETARYVAADPALATKAVVFTGAFKPERFTDSDAAFNVGCAVGALSVVAPGVYVAMNGRVMEAGLCKRNAAGKFVT